MSKLIRFINHSWKHFFIRDAEGSCDGSNLFQDDSSCPFAEGYFLAVQGKLLMNKEMWTTSALPVCLQIRKEVIFYRPTLGWTVGEASLLCKVSIYSLTVQPRAGRWMHTAYRPLKAEWSLQMKYLLSTHNYKNILPQPSLHFYSIRIIKIAATIESFWQYRLGCSQWE